MIISDVVLPYMIKAFTRLYWMVHVNRCFHLYIVLNLVISSFIYIFNGPNDPKLDVQGRTAVVVQLCCRLYIHKLMLSVYYTYI